ncbi:hypothetical protein Patl1_20330 [Pistacia atlantica]|uniref:Uncharacterized protein n=1 Tax=Pistacia atlantica TaxID=434234 RepID=A0ACC1BM83_9ROSI|nr:hypothetical protein Patl1_20330 [Pistacia atlantica]
MASKRSPNLNLEEGTERKFSRKLGVENEWIRSLPRSCYGIVAKILLHMKKIDPQGPLGLWIFLILCVIGISLDPLFFYIPVINDDKKCLKFDKKLGTTAIILRSLCRQVNLHKDACTVDRKYLLRFFPNDILAILPLPQVILLLVPTMRGSELFIGMKLLKFSVFFQYVPRVIRIYPLFMKATRISDVFDEAIWAKAAFNLLLYMLAGHVS